MRHPRDKPRVERSVPYVRERFFKGAEFRDLADMRSAARRWCLEVAGQRTHGTTHRRPLEVFREEERPALAPWVPRGTGNPTRRPTGARRRFTQTITSPAVIPNFEAIDEEQDFQNTRLGERVPR